MTNDIINSIVSGILAFIFYILALVLMFAYFRLEKRLDRYRNKYTFDREIEGKDISDEDKELKLNRRERRFKRRMLKD